MVCMSVQHLLGWDRMDIMDRKSSYLMSLCMIHACVNAIHQSIITSSLMASKTLEILNDKTCFLDRKLLGTLLCLFFNRHHFGSVSCGWLALLHGVIKNKQKKSSEQLCKRLNSLKMLLNPYTLKGQAQ